MVRAVGHDFIGFAEDDTANLLLAEVFLEDEQLSIDVEDVKEFRGGLAEAGQQIAVRTEADGVVVALGGG